MNSSATDDEYSQLLLERDCRLSFQLEGILRDAILVDPSDYGVDLAVAKIFTTYQPGIHRWEQLQSPNTRWLTCKTEAGVDRPSQIIHLNLLDGELRVDGQPGGGLPRAIRDSQEYQEIFRDVHTLRFLISTVFLTIVRSKASLSYHPIFQEWISQL